MTNISRKQYLISSTKRNIPKMNETHLSCGAYLYIDKELLVTYLADSKGRSYVVLGNVFCVDVCGKSIEEDIASFSGSNLNELVKNWTGRWLIISEREIQIDATGLMSAFYKRGKDWCISSSLALINFITNKVSSKQVSTQGLTWQLLPETLTDEIKSLFCTQKIEISKEDILVTFNPWIEDYSNIDTQEKVSRLANMLKIAISNIMIFSGREVWIALTSGKDSRLVLAAALAADMKFMTYTAEHYNISSADRKIPAKIAKDLGFSHRFIKSKDMSLARIKEYEIFTSGNSRGADEFFYARGQFDEIPSNAIVIRGGLFEAGQQYARKIAGAELDSFCRGIESYYQNSLANPKQSQAFSEWLKYINNNPIPFLDIRDRMYIEQRVGGWVAAIEQSLDLNDWISIQIANNRTTLSVLLSATIEERNNLLLSYDTISFLKPELCKYPFNKPSLKDLIRIVTNVLLSSEKMKRNIKRIF